MTPASAAPDGARGRRPRGSAGQLALATLLAGVGAGLAGALFWLLLHAVQHLALGPTSHGSVDSLVDVPRTARLLAPLLGGLLTGGAWWWLRRRWEVVPVTAVLNDPPRRLSMLPTWMDATLQTVVVATGASIGREGAPRQGAAALATWVSDRLTVDTERRRLLVAAAAGAGLAAVYNVPLAGAVYTLEVLLVTIRPRAVLVAAASAAVATVVAWPVVGTGALYAFPRTPIGPTTWLGALAAVPLGTAAGLGFAWVTGVARRRRLHGHGAVPLALALTGGLTGLASWWLPELPGNGKAVLDLTFAGGASLGGAVLLLVGKPLITAAWLRAGAAGGLLTPALATGAALGTVAALTVDGTGHPVPAPQLALIMAVAVLAVTQRAAVFPAVFGIELTHPPLLLAVVLVVTALAARLTAERARRYGRGLQRRRR